MGQRQRKANPAPFLLRPACPLRLPSYLASAPASRRSRPRRATNPQRPARLASEISSASREKARHSRRHKSAARSSFAVFLSPVVLWPISVDGLPSECKTSRRRGIRRPTREERSWGASLVLFAVQGRIDRAPNQSGAHINGVLRKPRIYRPRAPPALRTRSPCSCSLLTRVSRGSTVETTAVRHTGPAEASGTDGTAMRNRVSGSSSICPKRAGGVVYWVGLYKKLT